MTAHPVPQEGQKVYTLDELMPWIPEAEWPRIKQYFAWVGQQKPKRPRRPPQTRAAAS